MGFDAGAVVEPLDYDFTKYGGRKDTIPEPTDKQIDALFKDIYNVVRKLLEPLGQEVPEDARQNPELLLMAVAGMSDDQLPQFADFMKDLAGVFAKACTHNPKVSELQALPMRVRMHFYGWLVGELRPELFGAGSNEPQMGAKLVAMPSPVSSITPRVATSG